MRSGTGFFVGMGDGRGVTATMSSGVGFGEGRGVIARMLSGFGVGFGVGLGVGRGVNWGITGVKSWGRSGSRMGSTRSRSISLSVGRGVPRGLSSTPGGRPAKVLVGRGVNRTGSPTISLFPMISWSLRSGSAKSTCPLVSGSAASPVLGLLAVSESVEHESEQQAGGRMAQSGLKEQHSQRHAPASAVVSRSLRTKYASSGLGVAASGSGYGFGRSTGLVVVVVAGARGSPGSVSAVRPPHQTQSAHSALSSPQKTNGPCLQNEAQRGTAAPAARSWAPARAARARASRMVRMVKWFSVVVFSSGDRLSRG
mmetsp:Transcript_3428/g.10073  ORF Transcript_3428/g.10073 Transcript_3428/m.10073 type:complete len:312 (-) Transcript_3428:122-1057(-)